MPEFFSPRRTLTLLITVLSVLLLLGCSDEEPTPTSTPTPEQEESPPVSQQETPTSAEPTTQPPPDAYPYPPPGNGDGGYPAPQNDVTPLAGTIVEVPPPSSDSVGVVTGVLILDPEDGEPRPVQEAILYLGRIVMLDDGRPGMSALNKQTAPNTQTNLAGQFIFSDIEPGNYTLVFDRITESFVLKDPGGADLIIPVEPGQITDLGELHYSDLPLMEQ